MQTITDYDNDDDDDILSQGKATGFKVRVRSQSGISDMPPNKYFKIFVVKICAFMV